MFSNIDLYCRTIPGAEDISLMIFEKKIKEMSSAPNRLEKECPIFKKKYILEENLKKKIGRKISRLKKLSCM